MRRTPLYKRIVLGGTFDHIHIGHEKLLDTALELAETLSVGLTLPELYQKKALTEEIQSYEERERALNAFLKTRHARERVTLTPIRDVYGTTLDDYVIDAILVTSATEANAHVVNDKRKRRHLPELPITVVPLVQGDDDKIISSERIRRGEIDRQGNSYRKFILKKDTYVLPKSLRKTFQEPFGEIVIIPRECSSLLKPKPIFAVGDVVSRTLLDAGFVPTVCIIDYMTERKQIDPKIVAKHFQHTRFTLDNPSGTIASGVVALFDSADTLFLETNQTQTIVVNGEEDLLALPIMLIAPLGSHVVYGLKNVGMIVVEVTEDLKQKIHTLLMRFET